jgi:bacillolysin
LEVVAHELSHGVTDFTSNLIYQNESGALNESFSDVIGATVEAHAADNGLDGAMTADWTLAEDISLAADVAPGFRNMADPQEDADPDHYAERYLGMDDSGGVHSNSGISNHAYYLLVNGGKNAGCGQNLSGHTHTADCDITVTAVGFDAAVQIFYYGFTSLPENATFANARNASVAAATSLYSATLPQAVASTNQAWQAVGVVDAPPAPPCTVTATSLPFESDHPYANNYTCTWVYDNGSPDFRFHFSVLDVEANYDYVEILDADGNVLETITGAYRRGYTSDSIPTSVGQVRLRTDGGITKRGFVVGALLQP